MPITGHVADAARGVEAGVVEAGDDAGVYADGYFCISADHAGNGERLVEIALDARRAVDRD